MNKIYLAGPFFSKQQVQIIEQVEQALAQNPSVSDVYSPRTHQDGQAEAFTKPWADEIYHRDMAAIRASDAIVAIIDFDGADRRILTSTSS
ncbi:hypothetical protein IV38_GL000356 [Lactobacillus selangorensis]|uniref:Nucleoside 2-deoxyribosyltransferase n=1 Tax=Lactobacillus selangorensis TaxID=81857 RepID=A0A0R2FZM5_9LACO|nr:nucleoside 2-deoxyribosyltransferase [Lactobacillus selangorensis]KRN29472.1 hypothetical protein IV38_GL000356 [Lactobacillus selangorensis]KRN33999.1 hypothetical protein IV40_GL000312 [Lactobacillus selangorensis]